MNKTVAIILLVFGQLNVAFAGELYDTYMKNNGEFWNKWNAESMKVKSCADQKIVISFLKDAILLSHNDELIQANANTIETLAKANTECLVKALNKLPDKELKDAMRIYVANPYGLLSIQEVEAMLKPYFKNKTYSRIKKYFYSEKEW